MPGTASPYRRVDTDRALAAIKNADDQWPRRCVILNVVPADHRKEGSAFDQCNLHAGLPPAAGWPSPADVRDPAGGRTGKVRLCPRRLPLRPSAIVRLSNASTLGTIVIDDVRRPKTASAKQAVSHEIDRLVVIDLVGYDELNEISLGSRFFKFSWP
jgi:hypothetical protein